MLWADISFPCLAVVLRVIVFFDSARMGWPTVFIDFNRHLLPGTFSIQAHSPQLSEFLTSDLMSHLAEDAAPTRPAIAKGRL